MEKEFIYTKERLRFVLEKILEDDVREGARYLDTEHAEEGFEKRAVLEFLLWFLQEAFPDNFSFACRFTDLESDYPIDIARAIAEGRGWSNSGTDEQAPPSNVIQVDFKKTPGSNDSDRP